MTSHPESAKRYPYTSCNETPLGILFCTSVDYHSSMPPVEVHDLLVRKSKFDGLLQRTLCLFR